MRNGCDGTREGPTARCFITKTPQRPAALVPTAQPLGCSKTTAIVSAGSRGGRGVGGVVGDERADALDDDPLVGGRPVDEVREENPLFRAETAGSARMSRVCVGTPRGRSSITARASFVTTATWRGERPQPSRWGSMSGMRVPRKPMRGT